MKVINVSLILAAIAATAGAQQGKTISFGPVPGVAAGSTVPLDSAQFVFIGPNFGQLTISYPSVLGGTQSADRITFVVRKLDQVVPVVSSSVAAGTAAGSYSYTYMIGNSSPAGDQIKVWSLAVPATDAVDSASHSSWTTSQETAAGSPAAGLVGITPVALASWHAPAGGAIAASSAVSGFHVTSRYRPGLTFIYARSGEDYALPAPLPAQVSSQLDVMRQRDWMNKRVVGIGPRFPSDWTRDIIAADFKGGIARLIQTGDLDASSAFVTMLNGSLDVVINTQGASTPFAPVVALAGTQLEKNIANAISISLQ
jgi:hypothetical protein